MQLSHHLQYQITLMLLLIDKPSGITSHDAISAVKKHLRQPLRDAISDEDKAQGIKPPKIKIGHAGTLDPMASWLLIAATDSDTKQLHTLTGQDKRYETTIDFSIQTDTRDMDYRQVHKQLDMKDLSKPSLDAITSSLDTLIGTHDLPLTPFSAKKVDGKKLYDYARAWKPIFLTVPMTIHGYEIIDYAFPLLTLRLHVGSGTYIRSIAHRLGTQCDLGGTLTMLRRTQIGEYSIEQIMEENKQVAVWDEKEVCYTII